MIHISSSDALNQSLSQKFPKDTCIFFNENLEKGNYSSELFSFSFLKERAAVYEMSVEDYSKKVAKFITFLYTINLEEPITLWIDPNEFSEKNIEEILQTLKNRGYQNDVHYHQVEAPSTEILESKILTRD